MGLQRAVAAASRLPAPAPPRQPESSAVGRIWDSDPHACSASAETQVWVHQPEIPCSGSLLLSLTPLLSVHFEPWCVCGAFAGVWSVTASVSGLAGVLKGCRVCSFRSNNAESLGLQPGFCRTTVCPDTQRESLGRCFWSRLFVLCGFRG